MRDQSGSGWKTGIVTLLVALIGYGAVRWLTGRQPATPGPGGPAAAEAGPPAVPEQRVAETADAPASDPAPAVPDPPGVEPPPVPAQPGPPPEGLAPDSQPDTGSGSARNADPGTAPESPEGSHGPDSAEPRADGTPPPGFPVKANAKSRLYHTPDSPYYGRTRAQVCFRSEEAAEAAGFRHWDSRRRKT